MSDVLYLYRISWTEAANLFAPGQFYYLEEDVLNHAIRNQSTHPILEWTIGALVKRMTQPHTFDSITTSPSVVLCHPKEANLFVLTWKQISDKRLQAYLEADLGKESVIRESHESAHLGWESLLYLLLRKVVAFHESILDSLYERKIDASKPQLEQRIILFTQRIALFPHESTVQTHRYHLVLQLLQQRTSSESLAFLNESCATFPYDLFFMRIRHMLLHHMWELDPEELYDLLEGMTKKYPSDQLLRQCQQDVMEAIEIMYRPDGEMFASVLNHFTSLSQKV